MNSTTKKQAIYDSYGCTEEDLAYLFPKGTKVQLAFRNYSGYKTCSIFLDDFTSEEYDRRSQELVREHNANGGAGVGNLYHAWRSMALGAFEIEVGEIYGDVVINNGWDAKRYAKQLADRLGWEWEMI